jgi:hypothetical protein
MEGAVRVVNIYRILNFTGIFATIGSFLVALIALMPVHMGGPGEHPGPQHGVCETTLYEPAVQQLRAKPKPAEIDRFRLLGADPRFTYYYDYNTGEVSCVVRSGPIGPLVEASRVDAPDRTRRNGILVCVLVIVSAATGMKIIQLIRAGRDRNKE